MLGLDKLFGIDAFSRNKELLKKHGLDYSAAQHAHYAARLDELKWPVQSIQKTIDDQNPHLHAMAFDGDINGEAGMARRIVSLYVDTLNQVTGAGLVLEQKRLAEGPSKKNGWRVMEFSVRV